MYCTRGLTAWPEAVPRTGLRAGVGGARGAAAAWPRLKFLHSVPQGALLHITVIKYTTINKQPWSIAITSAKKVKFPFCRLGQIYRIVK